MKESIALYSIWISQHLLPFFENLGEIFSGTVKYFFVTKTHDKEHDAYGWNNDSSIQTVCIGNSLPDDLMNSTILLESLRNLDLLEYRAKHNLTTFYMAERWFKPPLGFFRMLVPSYFKKAWRFSKCAKSAQFLCLPMGIHAVRDMLRMLDWKRVDILIRAVKMSVEKYGCDMILNLYGSGPEEGYLKRLAKDCSAIRFHGFVKKDDVRKLMRAHDVYVIPSDGGEGWGATVSEALEEGMTVLGTYEAGASATLLSKGYLYPAKDPAQLSHLLQLQHKRLSIGGWSAENGASSFLKLLAELEKANVFSR